MEAYDLKIVHLSSGAEKTIRIEADEDAEDITLKTTLDGDTRTSSNCHYFAAFQNLRDQLLDLGYGMKCNGARENAVASPMMALVDKVYLVTLGEHARMKDVVPLFDFTDIDDFPNTSRQNQFFERWKISLTEKQKHP